MIFQEYRQKIHIRLFYHFLMYIKYILILFANDLFLITLRHENVNKYTYHY